VVTDHKNLIMFLTTKVLERRLARWYQDLATFKFKIHYRKGSENARANAMSCCKDYMKGEQKPGVQVMVRNSNGTLQINRIAATSGISNEQIIKRIKEALPADTFAKTVIASQDEHPNFDLEDRLLYFEGLVYVPVRVQDLVMQRNHDGPLIGHPGVTKMLHLMHLTYFFPKMRIAVEDYIRRCTICRQSKHNKHAPYGLLQPLQVPTKPWQAIAMDFIVKLLLSADLVTKESYDGIIVVTDCFTKFGRFIPYRETWTAMDLAHVFIKHMVANHRMPEQLVSD
jgi:hypothetical protein